MKNVLKRSYLVYIQYWSIDFWLASSNPTLKGPLLPLPLPRPLPAILKVYYKNFYSCLATIERKWRWKKLQKFVISHKIRRPKSYKNRSILILFYSRKYLFNQQFNNLFINKKSYLIQKRTRSEIFDSLLNFSFRLVNIYMR